MVGFVIARSRAMRSYEAIQLDRDECVSLGGHGALRDDTANQTAPMAIANGASSGEPECGSERRACR